MQTVTTHAKVGMLWPYRWNDTQAQQLPLQRPLQCISDIAALPTCSQWMLATPMTVLRHRENLMVQPHSLAPVSWGTPQQSTKACKQNVLLLQQVKHHKNTSGPRQRTACTAERRPAPQAKQLHAAVCSFCCCQGLPQVRPLAVRLVCSSQDCYH